MYNHEGQIGPDSYRDHKGPKGPFSVCPNAKKVIEAAQVYFPVTYSR
jgi:hypothetical protein